MANKVLFGFSDLYIGKYTVDDQGNVTMGTPYHQKGAVGWSPEGDESKNVFHADNIPYYTSYSIGDKEGDLVVAKWDDAALIEFFGYKRLADGGLAEIKNANKQPIYMMFAIQGDEGEERVIYYNGSFGSINREYATIEDSIEVQTETVTASFAGDNDTGISKVTYKEGDTGYSTLFSNPPAPVLPAES